MIARGVRWLVALVLLSAGTAARAQSDAPEVIVDGVSVRPHTPADAALERVLRSRCRDGLDEVRALSGDPSAPWAATVSRLCGNILTEPAPAGAPAPGEISEAASANEGRGRLALWSSLYGIWLGVATDVLFDVKDRSVILAPMVGMGLSLAVSLLVTSEHPVTTGQAWTIVTGLDYASANGALWGAGLGLSNKGVVGASVATSVVGTAAAIWVAAAERPKAGDIELVRSSLLWGTTVGLLGTLAVGPSSASNRTIWKAGAVAMDVSLLAGVGLANQFDLSRNRVLIIDAGALGGGLVGFGVAVLGESDGRGIAAGAVGGLLFGIGIAALATRHLDTPAAGAQALAYPALFARAADGRWSVSLPPPTPVLDASGNRPVGATLTAVGGLF
jgi:hypothetical protein